MEDGADVQPMAGRKVRAMHCMRQNATVFASNKPAVFACADCPREDKAAMENGADVQPMAAAALVGEDVQTLPGTHQAIIDCRSAVCERGCPSWKGRKETKPLR